MQDSRSVRVHSALGAFNKAASIYLVLYGSPPKFFIDYGRVFGDMNTNIGTASKLRCMLELKLIDFVFKRFYAAKAVECAEHNG